MATIVFYAIEPWHKEYLQKQLKKHKLIFIDEPLSEANAARAKDADVLGLFVFSRATKERLEQMPKLRLITTLSTGFDHIDLDHCAKKRIIISNVPAYGDRTVAEHTFGLLLNVTRKLFESIERTRSGRFDFTNLLGTDLHGKTLGVVGTGKIGRNVAHIANEGFGMKVIAYDIIKNEEWAKECGIQYVPFDKLLAESDMITFHVPLTKETTHLLNRDNISKVKKGAIIINTARGGIIETAALVDGLTKGILAGVGLDVLEEECDLREGKAPKTCSLLVSHPRAYITPHSAFYSKEALLRILDTTVENIESFLKGKPINLVK